MRSDRRLASPWTRVLTGAARGGAVRSVGSAEVAAVRAQDGRFRWTVGQAAGISGTREQAKLSADAALRRAGFTLVDAPGAAEVTDDEPQAPKRVYREG